MQSDSLYRISLKCLITNSDGKLLVVKESGRGSWDLPGGGIEHGEDVKAAIARELKEEIAYEDNFTYRILMADDPAKLRTRDVWQIKLVFRLELDTANFGAGHDADDVAFIHPNTFKDSEYLPEQKIYEYGKTLELISSVI
jgi:ADP-ribose pyrophosphatase YjhB (NUDIX family)